MKFKLLTIGSRVEYAGLGAAGAVYDGEQGTIVAILDWETRESDIGVDWDRSDPRKHDCMGHARKDHGWWVRPREIKLIF